MTSHRLRMAVGTIAAATGIAFIASSASTGPIAVLANDLCYSAGVSGTITGSRDTPRRCVGTTWTVVCTTPSVGLSPTIEVHAEACVPV